MPRLEDVRLDDLRGKLTSYEDYREVRRLLAALLYKQGPSAPTIAGWLDVRVATVYDWFDQFEDADDLEEALADERRPGRPPRLDPADRRAFERDLQEPPSSFGYDGTSWTPPIARDRLESAYGVSYSARHVRRLLADVGDESQRDVANGIAGGDR